MKKFLAIVLTLLMCMALFAGCGNDTANSDTPDNSDSNKAADGFPKDTITITVAYSAGGSSDKLARMVQPYLQEALGVNVVVENQGGASGQIATETFMVIGCSPSTSLVFITPLPYRIRLMIMTIWSLSGSNPMTPSSCLP